MTLLSRTAENLYWLGRYTERAENTARLLDVAYRMSQMPVTNLGANAEWGATLEVAGQAKAFNKRFKKLTQAKVIEYMTVDESNPSSIKRTLRAARENARAERNSIPTEVFENLNSTWLVMRDIDRKSLSADGYRDFFDWVKDRVHALRGLLLGVMLQTEAFAFNRIGTFIERADHTARLVDVKYVLLSAENKEDKIEDYYRWGALLRSLSAFKSYRQVYRGSIRPMQVVELLLLNPDFPRSINHCMDMVARTLDDLSPKAKSTQQARRLLRQFSKSKIDNLIKAKSLPDVIDEFTAAAAALSDQISNDFLFRP